MASLEERLTRFGRAAYFFGHNPWSIIGAVLTTSSAITMIAVWVIEMVAGHGMHPYAGILFFLVLPFVGWFERPKPLPESIASAVLAKNGGSGGGAPEGAAAKAEERG